VEWKMRRKLFWGKKENNLLAPIHLDIVECSFSFSFFFLWWWWFFLYCRFPLPHINDASDLQAAISHLDLPLAIACPVDYFLECVMVSETASTLHR
jgi:hypothetical protein